jgi:glycosyltransferase involved in cell wall biosynthesis
MPAPIRILQLCDRSHDFAKEFNLFDEVARGFAGADYEFTHSTLIDPLDEDLGRQLGCAVYTFNVPKRRVRATNLALLWRLLRYIRANRFDVIITHRFKPWLLVALLSPLLPGCRFIAFFRAFKQFDRRRRQWLAKLLLSRRWRMVGVSNAVREDLIAHAIPEALTAVIPNAINVAGIRARQYQPDAARAALELPARDRIIGTIGRAHPVKGHRYLIAAFARIAPRYPDTRLVIIGGGALEQALRQQAAATGVGARIHIFGAINDAYRYLKAFDLFVLSSLSEGFGLAIAEAMASGLPVIGTRVGGVPEAVGPHGVLVARADTDQLAAAIDNALAWPEAERREYIRQLEAHLTAQFSVEQYQRRYRELVAEMMQIS